MSIPNIQDLLTGICTAIEIGGFIYFTSQFIMGYPKWAAECTAARQISDSTIILDSCKSESPIEPLMEEVPTTEPTVPPDEWIDELFSTELPNPELEIDVQTKTETIQPTQADSPKQSRSPARKSKTEILRHRCSDHGIQWQSARADGRPLTKNQMINLLQQKQVDLSDIIPNANQTEAA